MKDISMALQEKALRDQRKNRCWRCGVDLKLFNIKRGKYCPECKSVIALEKKMRKNNFNGGFSQSQMEYSYSPSYSEPKISGGNDHYKPVISGDRKSVSFYIKPQFSDDGMDKK